MNPIFFFHVVIEFYFVHKISRETKKAKFFSVIYADLDILFSYLIQIV